MGKRTRYPGVTRLRPGTYKVRIQVAAHPRTGKPVDAQRTVQARNVREASAIRRELQEEMLRAPGGGRSRETLRTFASSWLKSKVARVAFSTAERYATALDLHILPALGDLYLDTITRRDIEDWVALQARVSRPETVNGRLQVLKGIMREAEAELGLANPTSMVAPLPLEARLEDDPNALTEQELQALLAAFQVHEPAHYPLILTIAMTGLRWGEAAALKWDDLDREVGVIRVRRSHWRGRVKGTKTGRPRLVPLPKQLLEVLDGWRGQLLQQQHLGLEAGWCFPSAVGTPRMSSTMTKPMRKALQKAGIQKRVTVQGLRRSAEDLLRRLGVSGPLAEALMGHNARMRSRYSTVADREVADLGPRLALVLGLEQGLEQGGGTATRSKQGL